MEGLSERRLVGVNLTSFPTSLYCTPRRGKRIVDSVEMAAIRQRVSRVGQIFSGPRALVEAIRIDKDKETDEDAGLFGNWSNKDLDPSSPSQRVWTSWSFFVFQFSIAFSPTTYNVGASLFAISLNWWTILIASCRVELQSPVETFDPGELTMRQSSSRS